MISKAEYHALLAKKYFKLWKIFIEYRKKKQQIMEKEKLFDAKISAFINNLKHDSYQLSFKKELVVNSKKNLDCCRKKNSEKAKVYAHNEIFVNRLQSQKEIIESQKIFIAEQNNLISALKQSISTGDNNDPKPKLQECINTTNTLPKEKKLFPKPIEHPIVKRMTQREEERKNRWFLLAMRKKEKERLLVEQMKKEEEEIKKMEVEERKRKIKEKQNEERIRKEAELQKQREQFVCQEFCLKMKSWYENTLLYKLLSDWRKFIKNLQSLQNQFTRMYERCLLQININTWKKQVIFIKDSLKFITESFIEECVLTNCWYLWRMELNGIQIKISMFSTWFDDVTKRRIFHEWQRFTHKKTIERENILKATQRFHERLLLMKTLFMWKKLPTVLYSEREKEKRLREWESKVKSILPDYNMDILPPL